MKRKHWTWIGRELRRQFLLGIVALVPIGITILILVWIFTSIDNILQPVIQVVWGHPVPGVGFGITIVLIYLVGVIASNVIGRRLIRFGESLLAKVPLVRPLYASIKQILVSFSKPSKNGFMQAVLLEFPRKGIWSMGFITKESPVQSGKTQLNVFIPTAPNPTTGFLQIVGEDEVIRTDIPIDEAVKMVLSAGRVSPGEINDHLSERIK